MGENVFREDFDRDWLSSSLTWLNEPADWKIEHGHLVIRPKKTDFWQKTHYGFEKDDGHCLLYRASGDWVLTTQVRSFPRHQYDQAGLMIRVSKDFWIKASVEYENSEWSRLGAVVTNLGYSDWSTQDFSSKQNEIELRATKSGTDYLIEFKVGEADWSQIRMAHLHAPDAEVACGIYACSPTDVGYTAEFDFLEVRSKL